MDLVALGRFLVECGAWVIAPPRCAGCRARIAMARVFCAACARTVSAAAPGERAPFAYGGALATAIARFKYEPAPHLARPLGELMLRGVARLGPAPIDVVAPVPLHPARLVARGFNQAALLASPVARALGAELAPRALVRTRDTARQAELDRRMRLVNVRGAFRARDRALVAGARVLLVDDVRTTGATLRACEDALREAGARDVTALVLAVAEA